MHMPQQSSLPLENFQPTISTISDTVGRNDGNNVDMEMESALLAQNNLLYNAMADVTTGYFADLRHAITEGKS